MTNLFFHTDHFDLIGQCSYYDTNTNLATIISGAKFNDIYNCSLLFFFLIWKTHEIIIEVLVLMHCKNAKI